MMTTVVLITHSTFTASKANRALLDALIGLPDLDVAELHDLYPDGRIDLAAERERLLRATRLIFQFPLQWYATPPLLKQWEDAVLTPIFYQEPATAEMTAGLPLLAATTTGGPPASFEARGPNGLTINDLFAPLRATARKCGWLWQPPFALHDVRNLDAADLARAGASYRAAVAAMPTLERSPAATA